MVSKEVFERIYARYRNVQGDLYHQIERIEHSINLLRDEKPSLIGRLVNGSKHYEKINDLVNKLNTYKTKLQAHAGFVDLKLSVLEKEARKPEVTVEKLEEIGNMHYDGVTTIEMPKDLKDELARHKINFGEEDKVYLTGIRPKQTQEQPQEREF